METYIADATSVRAAQYNPVVVWTSGAKQHCTIDVETRHTMTADVEIGLGGSTYNPIIERSNVRNIHTWNNNNITTNLITQHIPGDYIK